MTNVKSWKQFHSVITNGTDKIKILIDRYNCSIAPPAGMSFGFEDGHYYINGKRAWFQVEETVDPNNLEAIENE